MTSSPPCQAGILAPVPAVARYLGFILEPDAEPSNALTQLAQQVSGEDCVVGLGPTLVSSLGREIAGLHEPPSMMGAGISSPVTPLALWCWLRGTDRGEVLHRGRRLTGVLSGAFRSATVTDAFVHDAGRDLTGYEDGTENPVDAAAEQAALVSGRGGGLDGSSFVAVQRWVHDLDRFEALSSAERDATIGRRRSDNVELDDAPRSAHVKRTAQESFTPEAFVVRRSMPWAEPDGEGLMFVAFGRSFGAFEAQWRRMLGIDDGITDALFRFTRPVRSSHFWCPPVAKGQLDLSALGL